ncbi:MAG: hypothetical protein IKY75_04005 [Bacteroidaceae bacterium]|nr:hypothetical protein [Bacteroidaceae bacterium]
MTKYKLFLVLLFFVSPLLSLAQNHNVIVRLKGDVQIMHRGDKHWKTLQKRDTVKLIDKINLSPNSSVSIMKTSTRAVYTVDNAGQMTVRDIIKKAEGRDMAVISNVLKENASSGGEKTRRDFTSYGASVRGQGDTGKIDAVYACIYKAINNIYARSEIKEDDKSPAITRIYADDTYSFKVANIDVGTCYVNMFCVNLYSESVEVCYPRNISIANMSTSEFMLPGEFYDSEDVVYLFVASTVDYDSSLISLKLKNGEKPQNNIDDGMVKCTLSADARKLLQRNNK